MAPGPLAPDAIKAMAALAVAQDATIPAGHRGALVAVVNMDHVEFVLATRVGKGWTVDIAASYAWTGDPKVEATIKKTWG